MWQNNKKLQSKAREVGSPCLLPQILRLCAIPLARSSSTLVYNVEVTSRSILQGPSNGHVRDWVLTSELYTDVNNGPSIMKNCRISFMGLVFLDCF